MPTVFYAYDPLNRLIQTAGIQRFYNSSRMTTEIQGVVQRSVFQVGDHLLAEGGAGVSNLLATDLQRSVLHTVNPDKIQPMAYNVYGHRPAESGLSSVLGFNGERAEPVTGHYVLGNGYRAFNPVLMRFNSPDSWSPFGKGGVNSYAYCNGNPLLRTDPTGHFVKALITVLVRRAGRFLFEFMDHPLETIARACPKLLYMAGGAAIDRGIDIGGAEGRRAVAIGVATIAIGNSIDDYLNSMPPFFLRHGAQLEHQLDQMGTQAQAAHDELTRALNIIDAQRVEIGELRARGAISPPLYRDSHHLFGPPPASTRGNAGRIRRQST